MLASFVLASSNKKTGPIPVTMTEQKSCPNACPFKSDKTCYPYFSPLGFQWEALNNNGFYDLNSKHKCVFPISWDELCNDISKLPKGQLWRHNAAGDLPGINDVIDLEKLQQLINANNKSRARGFTYTHKPVGYSGQKLVNATAIYAANKSGFRINLSANSLCEVDYLSEMNIAPVVVVIPSDSGNKLKTPKGRLVIACPAENKDNNIQCSRCGLCAKDRKVVVAFHAHGTKVKAVNELLRRIET
jgi:hypothetical protein